MPVQSMPMATGTAMPMATGTAMPMATATATAVPMPMATATATPMPVQGVATMPVATATAIPVQAGGVPQATGYPSRFTRSLTRHLGYGTEATEAQLKKRMEGMYCVCTGSCLVAFILFPALFIPGAIIWHEQEATAQGVSAELGEDGGLTPFTTSPCTVAAVYHTNTVMRQLAHVHHPHSPDSKGRRLGEIQPVRQAYDFSAPSPPARHEHTPRKAASPAAAAAAATTEAATSLPSTASTTPKGPAPHPHTPVTIEKGKLKFDDGTAYEGEFTTTDGGVSIFHGRGTYSHADGVTTLAGVFESGEYVCDKCVERRRGRSLSHEAMHWIDTCYDRFTVAFAPGGGYENGGSLDTLSQMDARMSAAGYVKLSAATPPAGSTPVVLSPPMNKKRTCDFTYHTEPPSVDWRISYRWSGPSNATYAPPEMAPTCSQDWHAWYTNSPNHLVLDDDTGEEYPPFTPSRWTAWTQDKLPPLIYPDFFKQAPTEWELANFASQWIWADHLTQTPPSVVVASGVCQDSYFGDSFAEACMTRQKPSSWVDACPFTVGQTVPCWYLNPSSGHSAATRDLIKRQHGCKAVSTSSITTAGEGMPIGRDGGSPTLVLEQVALAGPGPSNPDCMTVFPPSWRTKDYYIYAKLAQARAFNTRGLLLVPCILCPALLVLMLCTFCKAKDAEKEWKAARGTSSSASVSAVNAAA